MSISSKIPQIIYNSLLPNSRKVEQLTSFFSRQKEQKKKNEIDQTKFSLKEEGTPAQEGHNEHLKNEMRAKEDAKSVVDQLVKKSNRRIIRIDAFSFIPFRLFINTIEVEESRVIFIFKQPFTFQSHSVDIVDISNVFIESAFLFAKMQIVSRTFVQNEITIGYLNRTFAWSELSISD
jgi:hypothetical protein